MSSTLSTWAPRSPRTSVANGPGSRRVRSRTRTPSSGRGAVCTLRLLQRKELLELHREEGVAGDLELAGEVERRRVGRRVLIELLEVFVAQGDRAVCVAG